MKKQIKKSELARVRAPKGYRFEIIPPETKGYYAYVKLYKKGVHHPIGRISLEPHSNDKYVTHSTLDEPYHGKGLGALMYARAIQWCLDNGYKVSSSSSPSSLAQRVWGGSSLRRYFSIRRAGNDGDYYKTWSVLKQKKKPTVKVAAKTKARKKSK